MSTRYNTGNPIESTDVRDMSDNAKNFDEFVNSASDEFTDRLGIERKTIHGMNSEFDSQILNMGFTRVGTFAAGATLTNPRQTLLWDIADGGDGQEYGWSGTFSKIVPPGSTPNTTGGIAVGAWMSRFDPELKGQVREALRRSYAEAGYNLVDGSFEAGGTVTSVTDVLLYEATGIAYLWLGALPKVVPAGSTPASTGGIDSGAWVGAAHSNVEERLLGVGAKIYRGSNEQYVQNGDVVPAETTHLRVLINGKVEDVAMSPIASGTVSDLTDVGATVDTVNVIFIEINDHNQQLNRNQSDCHPATAISTSDASDVQTKLNIYADRLNQNESDIQNLFNGQNSGVIVFQTYALLDAYAPANSAEEKGSFKVTNDPDSSLNGYYHWVSGTTYAKDSDLVVNQVSDDNTSDAVSGAAVRRYTQVENVAPLTPNLLDEKNSLAGYFIENTGTFVANAMYRVSDFIKVEVGETYKIYKDDLGLKAGRARKSCYYDSNFKVVAGGSTNVLSGFTVPSGVTYVRLSTYQADYDDGDATTLVSGTDYPLPVVFPYYAKSVLSESVATKTYGGVVEEEATGEDAILSRSTIESLISSPFSNITVNTNYALNGDYIIGDADTRGGSSGIDLTDQTELLARGYSRAMQWRISGNEYVRGSYGDLIVGKYITAGFFCYSENPANLTLLDAIYSENSVGNISGGTTKYSGVISLSDKLVFVYRQALVTQADAINALYGAGNAPVDNTRLATGFTIFITEDALTELEFFKYVLINEMSRLTAKHHANAVESKLTNEINYLVNISAPRAEVKFGGIDGITSIFGTKYTRNVLPFASDKTITSNVFNFDSDLIGTTEIRTYTRDDVAPIHAFGTTLLANHGYRGCMYNIPAHGKTDDDIGSIFSNSSNQYVLIGILNANSLVVMDIVSNTDTYPKNDTLAYISGGVDTNDLVVTTKSFLNVFPCVKDYSIEVLVDGVLQTNITDTVGYNQSVIFNESCTLLTREDLINWYLGGDTSTPPTGDSQLYQTVSYQFDWEGNCTITADYTCADVFSMSDIMALQAIKVAQLDKYYIPKTVEFDYKGTPRNFSMIEPSTVCTDAGGDTNIYFTSEKLDASPIKSDRWLQLGDDGVFAMGFLPVGSAGLNRDTNITEFTCEIRGESNKMYPRLLDVGNFTTSVGDSWGCVAYRIVHVPHEGATATYPVRTQGDDYYFIDYHNTNELVSIPMPDDYVGREFEVVESRNITCVSTVVSHKLSCLVNCAGDYGYLVLKVKR